MKAEEDRVARRLSRVGRDSATVVRHDMGRAMGLRGMTQAQRRVAPLALMCALVLALHDAAAATNAVRVRVSPATVRAGESVVIAASGIPTTATCRPMLRSPTGSARSLASKKARSSQISWAWLVPKTAAPGRWTASVACVGAPKASAGFTVLQAAPTPPPPQVIPAKLEVEKYGFGLDVDEFLTWLNYGAVIRNLSPDEDALYVTVLVNVIGSNGQILESQSTFYAAIPAATTYYAGDVMLLFDEAPAVARIDVSVSFREGAKKAITLPPVSNVRVQGDQGPARVAGELQNTATTPLSEFAEITAVVFDAAGNVLGGGSRFPGAYVPPGERIGFEIYVWGRTYSEVASAQVSVESEYAG